MTQFSVITKTNQGNHTYRGEAGSVLEAVTKAVAHLADRISTAEVISFWVTNLQAGRGWEWDTKKYIYEYNKEHLCAYNYEAQPILYCGQRPSLIIFDDLEY